MRLHCAEYTDRELGAPRIAAGVEDKPQWANKPRFFARRACARNMRDADEARPRAGALLQM